MEKMQNSLDIFDMFIVEMVQIFKLKAAGWMMWLKHALGLSK